MIRVALIGQGMAATVFHAPLIGAVPSLIRTGMHGRAEVDAVLADAAIDIVVIATPNETHADLVDRALRAGKHVVVDKPAMLTLEEADHFAELASKVDRRVIPFHNRRWDGDFLAVEQVVRSRQLGEIRLLTAHWDRFRPYAKGGWREGSSEGAGLLWDLGPHMIDQMLRLMGRPDAVQADMASQRLVSGTDDYFELTFRYGGARVVLGASTIVAPPRPRFAIYGTEGSYLSEGLDAQEGALKAGMHPADPGFASDGPRARRLDANGTATPVKVERGRYLTFYEQVAAACEGAASPVDLADAREGVRLILAARESAATGKVVWTGAS